MKNIPTKLNQILKTIQNIIKIPFCQGRTEVIDFWISPHFSDESMIWWVHVIDQSEKSEIVDVHYPKIECHPAMISKKEKWENSKVNKCNLLF